MVVGGRFNGCGMRELWDIGWGRRKISGFIQNWGVGIVLLVGFNPGKGNI